METSQSIWLITGFFILSWNGCSSISHLRSSTSSIVSKRFYEGSNRKFFSVDERSIERTNNRMFLKSFLYFFPINRWKFEFFSFCFCFCILIENRDLTHYIFPYAIYCTSEVDCLLFCCALRLKIIFESLIFLLEFLILITIDLSNLSEFIKYYLVRRIDRLYLFSFLLFISTRCRIIWCLRYFRFYIFLECELRCYRITCCDFIENPF